MGKERTRIPEVPLVHNIDVHTALDSRNDQMAPRSRIEDPTPADTRFLTRAGWAHNDAYVDDMYYTPIANPAITGLVFMPGWTFDHAATADIERFQMQGVLATILKPSSAAIAGGAFKRIKAVEVELTEAKISDVSHRLAMGEVFADPIRSVWQLGAKVAADSALSEHVSLTLRSDDLCHLHAPDSSAGQGPSTRTRQSSPAAHNDASVWPDALAPLRLISVHDLILAGQEAAPDAPCMVLGYFWSLLGTRSKTNNLQVEDSPMRLAAETLMQHVRAWSNLDAQSAGIIVAQ